MYLFEMTRISESFLAILNMPFLYYETRQERHVIKEAALKVPFGSLR